jgi:cilia- and flagella-associated protein 52
MAEQYADDGQYDQQYADQGYGDSGQQYEGKEAFPAQSSEGRDGAPAAALELEHAIGYNGRVYDSLIYHPNGTDFVYPAGGCLVVCDFNDPHNQVFLRGHDEDLSVVVSSLSGRIVATGQQGLNADVVVWQYGEGNDKSALYRLSEHDHGIAAMGFSQDERLLVTCGVDEDGKLFVWDLATGNIVATGKCPKGTKVAKFGGMVKNIKRRATGDYQFITAGVQTLCYWTLTPQTGALTCTKIPSRVQRNYTCASWSDDFEMCLVGSESGDFVFCVFPDKKNISVGDSVNACAGGVHSILSTGSLIDDSIQVIVGGGDGTVTTFTRDRRGFIDDASAKVEGKVLALSLSPDGAEVLAGTSSGFVYRLRTKGLAALCLAETHSASVNAVAYAPNVSEKFVTASADGTLRIWDASDYTVSVKCFVGDGGQPSCIALFLDAMISGWTDGKIRCHSATNGEWLWQIPNAHRGGVTALVLSSNQRFVISGGAEGEVRVWELRSRELVSHLKEHTMSVTGIALFDDDVHALTCSRDRSFLCWDLRREKRISNHTQRMGGMNGIALSRDQTQVMTVGQERKITYWDLREANPVQVADHDGEARCIAVSHTGQFVATGGNDQLVRLWDYATGKKIMDGVGHSGAVRSVAFSPDDRQLISVGEDGCIFVWNVYA